MRDHRLLRDDGAGARLRRAVGRDDHHLRAGVRRVRGALPHARLPQGLHRQRGPARDDGGRVRPAGRRGRGPGRRRPARGDHGRPGAQGWPAGRRQRHHRVRPRPRAPAHAPGPLWRRGRRRRLPLDHGEQGRPLLHDAGHAGPWPHLRRQRRRHGDAQVALDRRPLRPDAHAVPASGAGRGDHPARLPDAPAQAHAPRGARLRLRLRRQRGHAAAAARARRAGGRPDRSPRARDPGRWPQGAADPLGERHAADVPRGVRRRRLPQRERSHADAAGRRRVRHVRGRQHGAPATRGQGAAARLQEDVGRPRPAGHRPGHGTPAGRAVHGADGGARDHRPARGERPAALRGRAVARPRLARRDAGVPRAPDRRVAGGTHARGRQGARGGIVRGRQRVPGAHAGRRARPHRPGRAGGVHRRLRRGEGRLHPLAARQGLRPVRAGHDRGAPGVVPGAPPHRRNPQQGHPGRGGRAVRRPARAGAGAGRGPGRPGVLAQLGHARGRRRPARRAGPPPSGGGGVRRRRRPAA